MKARTVRVLILSSVLSLLLTASAAFATPAEVVVRAGAHDRKDTPVRVELPPGRIGNGPMKALRDGRDALRLQEIRDGRPVGAAITGQVDLNLAVARSREDVTIVRLTFVLPGKTPAHGERRFRFDLDTLARGESPWALGDPSSGHLSLSNRGRPVFRYNMEPVANRYFPKVPARGAYIHPAYTPSGAVITGDYSRAHPHHRGFFLAYTKTKTGDLHPDFWNIHNGTGIIVFDSLAGTSAGPVTARVGTRHRWEAKGGGTVLSETWDVTAYDVPGSPYWLFDLTSTQRAEGKPLELPTYRYGGMAYRGAEPFVKGPIDVLTSEGLDRVRGDQKPARWVDLTGPVADGSDRYGGAVVFDHPSNPHHPTPARIHPTSLPFFAFTPSHDQPLTIPADRPTVFRYRVMIHDGRPDRRLDELLWHDFAEPPAATVVDPTP